MTARRAPEARQPLRVAVRAPEATRIKALWVLESLLAVGDIPWTEVEPGSDDIDLGYGCDGALTLERDAAAWQATQAPARSADELAYAFWWLSRAEERSGGVEARDAHGRFRADRSRAAGTGSRAPVDDVAARMLERLGRRPAAWKGDHTFALALSHDIDTPVRWTRQGIRRCARRAKDSARTGNWLDAGRCLRALAAVPAWKLRGSDPHRNEAAILELERRHGGASTFYLLAGHHHELDGNPGTYDRVRAQVARRVLEAGGELGLHASYTASEVPARLVEERMVLEDATGAPIQHLRHHFLRHDPPAAWPSMSRAGFRTDSSLGYAEQLGFRSGFSYPYRAWDHEAGRPLPLVLVPLGIMDATLDDSRYGGLDPAGADRRIDALLRHGKAHGSGYSVLWHNDRFYAPLARGFDAVYERLLASAAEMGAWLAPVGEVAAEWEQRLAVARWSDAVAVLASERGGVPQ